MLSEGIRDGIESLLFDPVILVATIAKENPTFSKGKSILNDDDSYVSLGAWDTSRWQEAVNVVQKMVLGEAFTPTDYLEIEYINGMKLHISKRYLHMDDHELEQKILQKFEFLKAKNKHAGDLMRHISESVLMDHTHLLPIDLLTTFTALLAHEMV